MKILFITNGFPPHRWAGTETWTAGLAQELVRRGHYVSVLCAGDWQTGFQYFNGFVDDIYRDIPFRSLNFNWTKAPDPNKYLYNNPFISDFLTVYLNQIRPDLVHVTSCETLSASVIGAVRLAGLPLVFSLTDFWFLCPRINLLKSDNTNCDGVTTPWDCLQCKLLNEKVYKLPRRFFPESLLKTILLQISKHPYLTRQRGLRGLALDMQDRKTFLCHAITLPDFRTTASSFVQSIFIKNGIDVPIHIQPYGHDLSWLDGYSGKIPSDKIRIGYIGQIAESKGLHILLQAVQSILSVANHKFSIFIYGNPQHDLDYTARLRSLAYNLDDVHFCGTYPHERSASVFAELDVLVVPSLWFDFPLIIYEAFASHTPVVATNLGGMAEAVIHEVNGLLFERGDIDGLAVQLQRLVNEPDLLKKLSAGIPPVKRIEEEAAELEEIYLQLVV